MFLAFLCFLFLPAYLVYIYDLTIGDVYERCGFVYYLIYD